MNYVAELHTLCGAVHPPKVVRGQVEVLQLPLHHGQERFDPTMLTDQGPDTTTFIRTFRLEKQQRHSRFPNVTKLIYREVPQR